MNLVLGTLFQVIDVLFTLARNLAADLELGKSLDALAHVNRLPLDSGSFGKYTCTLHLSGDAKIFI